MTSLQSARRYERPFEARRGCGILNRWCLASVGLLAVLVVLSASRRAEGSGGLTAYASEHYTIHTNLRRSEAVAYGRHMDLIFAEYSRRFRNFSARQNQPMPLYLLRTRHQYIALMKNFGFDASSSGGMFFVSPRASGLATWVEGLPRAATLETLQHEGFHQFAHAYIGHQLPIWVNEGLAEYFGDGLIVRGKMKVGLVTERRLDAVQAAIRDRSIIDFDQLLSMTPKQWQRNMAGRSKRAFLQYQQSWSMVYFLIHGDKGKYRSAFEQYLMLVNGGHTSDVAFRKAFGDNGSEPFRLRWKTYTLALKPDVLATAIARMRFLGRGLAYLRENQQPIPNSIEDLRRRLRSMGFRVISMSHGFEATTVADNIANFGFRRDNGSQGWFKLLEAESNNLLPRVVAPGLRPEPMLVWFRDPNGRLEYQIRYR